jgi:hypothetical protein
MTKDSSYKRHVRARMTKTGESYTAARSQVVDKRDRVQAARTRLADTADRPAEDKVTVGPVDHRLVRAQPWAASEAPAEGRVHVIASKTIAVPAGVLFDALVEPRSRRKWLTDGTMRLRTSQPGRGRSLRLDGRVDPRA